MQKSEIKPPRTHRCTLAVSIALGSFALAPTTASANQSVELAPVTVTGAGFEQLITETPASISVITREDLQRRQVSSLAEALEGIEGVNVRPLDARDGKTGNQSISLRGLPREYTLILIDGVRQNPRGLVTPNSFDDTQSVFIPPVAAIERIEVIRGPMSTLYGSDAMGGVVNIITRRPGTEWNRSVSVSNTFQSDSRFGGESTLEGYASGPLIDDRLSLQVYGRLFERAESQLRIPGVDQFDDQRLVESATMGQNPVGANISTVGGQLLFTPNRQHELTATFNYSEQEYNNDRGQIGGLHRERGDEGPCATGSVNDPNFCRGYERELQFNRSQFTLGHLWELDYGFLETKLTRDFLETKGRTIAAGSGLPLEQEGGPRTLELETYILDTRLVSFLGDHVLTVGGQYIDPELTDGLFGGGSVSVSQHSLFVENEWSVRPDELTLTGGLRYDDNEAFSGQLNPRAYAVWSATDEWTFKGGAGRGFRAPEIQDLTDGIIGFGDRGSRPIRGNPELEPEIATNVEASALYDSQQGFRAQATVFHTKLEDLVESGTGANEGRSLNIGEAVVQGLELEGSYRFNPAWTLSANYTYTDSEVTKTQLDTGDPLQGIASKEGDPLTSVPDHMLNATLAWQATPQLETFLSAEYRSSAFRPRNYHEPMTGGNSQGAVEEGWRDSNRVIGDFSGYTLWNLGANYHVSDNVRLNGVITNLLDKDFKDYKTYDRCDGGGCTVVEEGGLSNRYNTILPGRAFFVSVSADF
ncbi:TonB-dependent receptor domain-containing protein [Halorhodospira abdelmalekii]|uniref:TonB-dependent receptor domain-containing protein n=1 Tax=Halorhodospira abdelmalekii TaxID=421629 RepID=UPI003B849808